MAYVTSEARQELLDEVARATDGSASRWRRSALPTSSSTSADRRPAGGAAVPARAGRVRPRPAHLCRVRRAPAGSPAATFAAPQSAGLPSQGVRGFIERASGRGRRGADVILADLQDSMRPVEVGDAELRAGLAEVRELLGDGAREARELMRMFGR